MKQKVRRAVGQIYRSKGERNFVAGYYHADFVIDSQPASLAKVG